MRKLILATFALLSMAATSYAAPVEAQKTAIVGIGVVLKKAADGSFPIKEIVPNGPAERTGLRVGDSVVAVQPSPDTSMIYLEKLTLGETVLLIRGPVGVPVRLLMNTTNGQSIFVSVAREKIEYDGTN